MNKEELKNEMKKIEVRDILTDIPSDTRDIAAYVKSKTGIDINEELDKYEIRAEDDGAMDQGTADNVYSKLKVVEIAYVERMMEEKIVEDPVLEPNDYTYMGRLTDDEIKRKLLKEELELSDEEIEATIDEYKLVPYDDGARDDGYDNPIALRQLVKLTTVLEEKTEIQEDIGKAEPVVDPEEIPPMMGEDRYKDNEVENVKEQVEKFKIEEEKIGKNEEYKKIQDEIRRAKLSVEKYEQELKSLNTNSMDNIESIKEHRALKDTIALAKERLENLEKEKAEMDKQRESQNIKQQKNDLMDKKSAYYTQTKMKYENEINKTKLKMQKILQDMHDFQHKYEEKDGTRIVTNGEEFRKLDESYKELQSVLYDLQNAVKLCNEQLTEIKAERNKSVEKINEILRRDNNNSKENQKDTEQENDEKKASEKENDDNEKDNNEKDVNDKDNNEKENDAEPVVDPDEIEKMMKDDENEVEYEDIDEEDISLVPKESMMDKFKKTKIAGVFKGLFNGAKKFFSSIKNFVDRRRAAKEEYGDNGKMWKNADKAAKDVTEKNEIDKHIEILSKIANEAENERNAKNGSFVQHVDVNEAEAIAKTEHSTESKTKKDKGREMVD